MLDARAWRRLIGEESPTPSQRLLLAGLSLISMAYWMGLSLHRSWWRLRGSYRPPVPSLCVGNITLGGTGKTPFVRTIARRLRRRGRRVAVILRGYRGAGSGRARVVHDGVRTLLTVAESGDEAALLAQSLEGVGVVIGNRRPEAAALAIETLGAEVLVFDDGLQHWALDPTRTLVLWDATADPGRSRLFPRGALREPLSALGRFDLLALTRAEVDGASEALRALEPYWKGPHLLAVHRPQLLRSGDGETRGLGELAGARVLAASSIGNPEAFLRTLESLGARVCHEIRFPDHHTYSHADVRWILQRRSEVGAADVVVTEKDMVKLRAYEESRRMTELVVDLEPLGDGEAILEGFLDSLLSEAMGTCD